jgi:uncharacterized protein YceK
MRNTLLLIALTALIGLSGCKSIVRAAVETLVELTNGDERREAPTLDAPTVDEATSGKDNEETAAAPEPLVATPAPQAPGAVEVGGNEPPARPTAPATAAAPGTAATKPPLPAKPGAAEGAGCTNTCRTAFDTECDDGGPGSLYSICPLGTDCSDCGPR